MSNTKVKELNDSTLTETVSSGETLMVDFWAAWCGPCRMLMPILDQVADELEGEATIAKVNVDENKESCDKYNVTSLPTLLFFKDGEVKETIKGLCSKADIIEVIKSI
jgi:thioredoxin 1